MKRTILMGAALLAALTFTGSASSQAEAGGFGISLNFGNRGYYNRGYGFNRGYYGGRRHFSRFRGYRSFRQPRYHDTSHYDYHPGTYVPHGNHLHYQPGHYDFHQQGHWHH